MVMRCSGLHSHKHRSLFQVPVTSFLCNRGSMKVPITGTGQCVNCINAAMSLRISKFMLCFQGLHLRPRQRPKRISADAATAAPKQA